MKFVPKGQGGGSGSKDVEKSKSGGQGREKEQQQGRRQSNRGQEREENRPRTRHEENLHQANLLLDDGLNRAVEEGRIGQDQAAKYRNQMLAVFGSMGEGAMEHYLAGVNGYHFYRSTADVDAHYRSLPQKEHADWEVPCFYDPNDGTMHLDDNELDDYAHEMAHGIDGRDHRFTSTQEWYTAYRTERGRLGSEDYPTSKPTEWWAALVTIALTYPEGWASVRRRCPRSAKIIDGALA